MTVLDEPKGWVALLVGLLVTAIGLVPLLGIFGILPSLLPKTILNLIPGIAIWLIPAIAILLLIDSIAWEDDAPRVISTIVAIVFLAVGIVEILHKFSMISFGVPFITDTIYYVLFVLEGVFLVLATFWME